MKSKSCLASFFLTAFLFLPEAKEAELSMPKLSASISRVSVEGLKFVILLANFFLNLDGLVIVAPLLLTPVMGSESFSKFANSLNSLNSHRLRFHRPR